MPKKSSFADEADGFDLAANALVLAEPARHEHAVHPGQQPLVALARSLALQPLDADLGEWNAACDRAPS